MYYFVSVIIIILYLRPLHSYRTNGNLASYGFYKLTSNDQTDLTPGFILLSNKRILTFMSVGGKGADLWDLGLNKHLYHNNSPRDLPS